MKKKELRLENGVDSSMNRQKSRRNEQVTRSEAECQRLYSEHDVCTKSTTNAFNSGKGGVEAPSPSFLVLNKDNVNAQLHKYSPMDKLQSEINVAPS